MNQKILGFPFVIVGGLLIAFFIITKTHLLILSIGIIFVILSWFFTEESIKKREKKEDEVHKT